MRSTARKVCGGGRLTSCYLAILIILFSANAAEAVITFDPIHIGSLVPTFTATCTSGPRYEGTAVNATLVPVDEAIFCNKSTSSQVYHGKMVVSKWYGSLCGYPDTLRRSNLYERAKVIKKANVSFLVHFIRRGAVAMYNSYVYSDSFRKSVETPNIWCETPLDLIPYLNVQELTDDILASETMSVTGYIDENPWHSLLEGPFYHILFRYGEPMLYIITAGLCAHLAVKTITQTLHEEESRASFKGKSPSRRILEHKGGRSSVKLLLLGFEFVASIFLAVATFMNCNFCSKSSLDFTFSQSIITRFMFTSLSTTILAGVFWSDRRINFERKLRFAPVDDRAFLSRRSRLCVCCACILVAFDAAASIFSLRLRHFEQLVGIVGILLGVIISFSFLYQSRKFNTLVSSVKANAAFGPQHRAAHGLAKIESVTKWFVTSAFCLLLWSLGFIILLLLGPSLFTPSIWTCYWAAALFLRWLASFSQVLMCRASSADGTKATSVLPHSNVQQSPTEQTEVGVNSSMPTSH